MTAADAPNLVAVRLPAGRAWLAAVQAVWERGDAILPLPADSDATAAVTALRPGRLITPAGEEELPGGLPVAAGTAAVVTTSGSTGPPKGAVLSHAALRWSATASSRRLDVGSADRWLCCLPLHHVAGLLVVVRAALQGAEPVMHPGFDVEAVAAQRDVTMVALVPTMLRRLLDAGVDLGHLRCVLLGGAAADPDLLADAARAGVPVVTTYGMTETCGGCVYDGVPLDGVEAEVDDRGRIWIAGPVLFDGYRLDEEATAGCLLGGRLRTADLGHWTADGRLVVDGRADDVIVSGGENVSADAVSRVLRGHPAVREAAVVGRPHREWGQEVVAVVAGDGPLDGEELQRFAGGLLPRHAVPRAVVVVENLPRLDNGKVDRLAVRRLVAADGA